MEIDIYVRYCETDAGGHVNNSSYFIYFEEARTRLFEAIGYPAGKRSINFIVARTECDYLAQAYAGQRLTVSSKVSKIGTKSYTMSHEIFDTKSGDPIARGSAVIVCFDYETQQSIAIPNELREKLLEHLNAKEYSS